MHTDEAVNAYLTGELLAGESFHYDPGDRHGPALFLFAKPLAQVGGAGSFSQLTESGLRLTAALAGTATVLLFGAGVELFGFVACLFAASLFAFAPLPLYYSRYFIHEPLFVATTFGLMLAGGQALRAKSRWYAALAGFCAALLLAGKETAFLHFFALGFALVSSRFVGSQRKDTLPLPSPGTILTATAIFVCVSILLFSWFGNYRPWPANLLQALPDLALRAAGAGHAKPFYFYLVILADGWSGGVLLVLAACGMFVAARNWTRGAEVLGASGSFASGFIALYGLAISVTYAAIPYKTPWLALNVFLPLALLAGLAIQSFWLARPNPLSRSAILAGLLLIGCLLAHDSRKWVFKLPADEQNPYAYAHTSEDLLRLPERLAELARQNHLPNPRIAVVAADPWPLPWYLRKFPQTGFWQPGRETGAADFFITPAHPSDELAQRLEDRRPEYFGARPGVLLILWPPPSAGTNPP